MSIVGGVSVQRRGAVSVTLDAALVSGSPLNAASLEASTKIARNSYAESSPATGVSL